MANKYSCTYVKLSGSTSGGYGYPQTESEPKERDSGEH